MGFVYIVLTVMLTVYGQLVLKWQVNLAGQAPEQVAEKFIFVARLLLSPWVISGFAAAFLASMTWMAAMTKFDLSSAYPFMSLNFVLVMVFGAWLFDEPVTAPKLLGIGLVVLGLVVLSRG